MKKLALVMLALTVSLQASTDFSGIWNGKGGYQDAKYGSVPATAQLTLLQSGSSIKGTLKIGNSKPIEITSGSVSGSEITFVVKGGTGTLTQNGSKLQGKLTSSKGKILDIVFTK